MTLFWTMLPIYILGNLHCLGMCGPLALMLGQHRYRYFYFFGRLCSFTLAGLLAGGIGAILALTLHKFHVSIISSFLFGGLFLAVGLASLVRCPYPGYQKIASWLKPFNDRLSILMLRDEPWAAFLFGFFTIALPCGQTLIVFSACALSGSPLAGIWNGCAFALLTSPSLLLAMHAHSLLKQAKRHYQTILGICSLAVGGLTICRGLADAEMIPHWILSQAYHVVVF